MFVYILYYIYNNHIDLLYLILNVAFMYYCLIIIIDIIVF